MRVTVFAFDLPYPANSGGRLDIWSQLLAMIAAGYKVQLWCFTHAAATTTDIDVLRSFGLEEVHVLAYTETQARKRSVVCRLGWLMQKFFSPMPSCVSGTNLNKHVRSSVVREIDRFAPSVIVAHGIQTTGAVRSVVRRLPHIPWVYRSHNNERNYYREQARAAEFGVKMLGLSWQRVRLAWYEPWLLRKAGAVLNISKTEHELFVSQGYEHQFWVPPVYTFYNCSETRQPTWDVGILSSWFASQKQEGLRWFFEKVRPLFNPQLRVLVAGSGWLKVYCESKGAVFLGPVDSPTDFYSSSRVIVNPVLRGAGVNMKTMEMLSSGRALVSTPAGMAGLPDGVADWVRIGINEIEMAKHIEDALLAPPRVVPVSVFDPFSPKSFIATFTVACSVARQNLG